MKDKKVYNMNGKGVVCKKMVEVEGKLVHLICAWKKKWDDVEFASLSIGFNWWNPKKNCNNASMYKCRVIFCDDGLRLLAWRFVPLCHVMYLPCLRNIFFCRSHFCSFLKLFSLKVITIINSRRRCTWSQSRRSGANALGVRSFFRDTRWTRKLSNVTSWKTRGNLMWGCFIEKKNDNPSTYSIRECRHCFKDFFLSRGTHPILKLTDALIYQQTMFVISSRMSTNKVE